MKDIITRAVHGAFSISQFEEALDDAVADSIDYVDLAYRIVDRSDVQDIIASAAEDCVEGLL